jgi:hypothetical protein
VVKITDRDYRSVDFLVNVMLIFPSDFVFATFSHALRVMFMLQFSSCQVVIHEPIYTLLAFSAFTSRPSLVACEEACLRTGQD